MARSGRFHDGGWLGLGPVRFEASHGDFGDLTLPRLVTWSDGDGTNAIYYLGLKLGTKWGDAFLHVGVQLTVPPPWWRVIERVRGGG